MASIGNHTLNLLGIYHQNYSTGQRVTNVMFLDGLTEKLTEWMSSFKNIFIGGDINIHMDDKNDAEAQILMIPWKLWIATAFGLSNLPCWQHPGLNFYRNHLLNIIHINCNTKIHMKWTEPITAVQT